MTGRTKRIIENTYVTIMFGSLGTAFITMLASSITGKLYWPIWPALCMLILSVVIIPIRGICKPLRVLSCSVGWHCYKGQVQEAINKDPTGFQSYAKCPWCSKECMIDSQGNLF